MFEEILPLIFHNYTTKLNFSEHLSSLLGGKSLGYTKLRASNTKILAFLIFILKLLEV